MIVTFYSYKGGVGRSMALANVAQWLRLRGLRVVIVDWDLEAPGLESFFVTDPAAREALRSRLGVVDLISTYQDLFPSLPRAEAGSSAGMAVGRSSAFVQVLSRTLPPLAPMLLPVPPPSSGADVVGKLWLLGAGRRTGARFESYAETVQRFDWGEFYARYEGEAYFEWMRQQLLSPELADVVLIDSRTGVAEMSGVCTRQLADVVVLFSAPNDQNLDGIALMAGSFVRSDLLEARGGRPLQLLAVPARVDQSDGVLVDRFEKVFHEKLERYTPEILKRIRDDRALLRIPYVKDYAYSERLAIGDPEGSSALQNAYATLAAHLAVLAPADSALKIRCGEVLERTFHLPTVMVLQFQDDDPPAIALRDRLDREGMLALPLKDTASGPSRAKFEPTATVVAVVTPELLATPRVEAFWRSARQQGASLFLVRAGHPTLEHVPPRWATRERVYDADAPDDWKALVAAIRSPVRRDRVPSMAPPAASTFVGRDAERAHIKEMLLRTEMPLRDAPSRGRAIALLGLGGSGKTALARVICADADVVSFFYDGIVWLSLGPEPDLGKPLRSALTAFGIEAPAAMDVDIAERRLADVLEDKRCLMVLDDVLDPRALARIPRGGPGCRTLLTTRSREVAAAASAHVVEIGAVTAEDARRLLATGLGQDVSEEVVSALAHQFGGLPLALEIASRLIRTRVDMGEQAADVARDLLRRFEEEGIAAFDEHVSLESPGSGLGAFLLAIDRLSASDRARLPLLASLPAGEPLTIERVAQASGADVDECQQMLRRMAALSLVRLDVTIGTVVFHPLVLAFFRTLERRQRRAEATRQGYASAAPARTFISYRRDDGAYAARLFDRLSEQFGYDRIFMDVDAIPAGADLGEALGREIASSRAVLVVIGRGWNAVDSGGRRRIDRPDDVVRLEIRLAAARGTPLIPVLVDGAAMPAPEELPDDLRFLSRLQACAIGTATFHQDVDRLVAALERIAPVRPSDRPLDDLPAKAEAAHPPPPAPAPISRTGSTLEGGDLEAPPRPRSRTKRLMVVGTAAAAAIGLAVGVWQIALAPPGTVVVPKVIGMQLDQAERTLGERGLKLGTTQREVPGASGRVLSQSPEPGSSVPRASAVDLVVAKGTGSQPDASSGTGPGSTASPQATPPRQVPGSSPVDANLKRRLYLRYAEPSQGEAIPELTRRLEKANVVVAGAALVPSAPAQTELMYVSADDAADAEAIRAILEKLRVKVGRLKRISGEGARPRHFELHLSRGERLGVERSAAQGAETAGPAPTKASAQRP